MKVDQGHKKQSFHVWLHLLGRLQVQSVIVE